jgi:hypothetical protein
MECTGCISCAWVKGCHPLGAKLLSLLLPSTLVLPPLLVLSLLSLLLLLLCRYWSGLDIPNCWCKYPWDAEAIYEHTDKGAALACKGSHGTPSKPNINHPFLYCSFAHAAAFACCGSLGPH